MSFLLVRGAIRAALTHRGMLGRGAVPTARSVAATSSLPPPPLGREIVEVVYVKEPEMKEYCLKGKEGDNMLDILVNNKIELDVRLR